MKKQYVFLLLFFSSFFATLKAQNIYYVTVDGTGTGTSWDNASTLQAALDVTTAGDQIWVKEGTYYPTQSPDGNTTDNRDNAFHVNKDIKLYGGFTGTETAINQRVAGNTTTLSGDLGTINDTIDNAYHVLVLVDASSTMLIEGFTITGGNANGTGSLFYDGDRIHRTNGGGIYSYSYSSTSSSPTLTNCTVSNNLASFNGGGIYSDSDSDSSSSSSPTLTNCTVSNNSASSNGGGIFSFSSSLSYDPSDSSSISSPTLTNCIVSNNSASGAGGGIYSDSYSTFSTSSSSISNTVFWQNGTDVEGGVTSTSSNNASNITGTFVNNFIDLSSTSEAEIFTDVDNEDYTLPINSPLIDKGDTTKNTTTTDLEGKNRVIGDVIDIGAYEKRSATDIAFSDISKTYGDATFNLSATSTSTTTVTYSIVNGGTGEVTLSGENITLVKAGTVTLKASVAENDTFEAAEKEITLTINKAPLTVTADAGQSKIYGASEPTSFDYTISGFANSDTETSLDTAVSIARATGEDVGTYTITPSAAAGANYTVSFVNADFTINKAAQTITFDALVHTDDVFDLTATSSSGLAITYTSSDTSVATISGNTVTVVSGGVTTIEASQSGNDNYNSASEVLQTLTIATLGIEDETEILEVIKVYPNPAVNFIRINIGTLDKVSIKVFNINGKLVLNKEAYKSEEDLVISNLSNGVYLLKIESSKGNIIKRFIKK